MARPKCILQSEFPYQITARCINREWFNLPMPLVWDIFCEELARVNKENHLQIHSFILMTNHFHLIASTPQANISHCMQLFMGRTSRRLTRAGNRINETFAGRHHKCILNSYSYFLSAYKYNYRNPVSAGICDNVEEYSFSTLQAVLGKTSLKMPLVEDANFNLDPLGTLRWLNSSPTDAQMKAVKWGLKKPFFQPKKIQNLGSTFLGVPVPL